MADWQLALNGEPAYVRVESVGERAESFMGTTKVISQLNSRSFELLPARFLPLAARQSRGSRGCKT